CLLAAKTEHAADVISDERGVHPAERIRVHIEVIELLLRGLLPGLGVTRRAKLLEYGLRFLVRRGLGGERVGFRIGGRRSRFLGFFRRRGAAGSGWWSLVRFGRWRWRRGWRRRLRSARGERGDKQQVFHRVLSSIRA